MREAGGFVEVLVEVIHATNGASVIVINLPNYWLFKWLGWMLNRRLCSATSH
jgi:hypothetical protein